MSLLNSCQIHLKDDARLKAAKASYPIPEFPRPLANTDPAAYIQELSEYQLKYADELQAQRDFTGPNFRGCVEAVRFGEGFVHVFLRDEDTATVYSYPVSDVARIKQYNLGA